MSKQFLPVFELHTLPWYEGHVKWVRSGGAPLSSKEESKCGLLHAVFDGMRNAGEDDNAVTGLGELYTVFARACWTLYFLDVSVCELLNVCVSYSDSER
jgi:hypothetical protein